jgi:hypothetical protein
LSFLWGWLNLPWYEAFAPWGCEILVSKGRSGVQNAGQIGGQIGGLFETIVPERLEKLGIWGTVPTDFGTLNRQACLEIAYPLPGEQRAEGDIVLCEFATTQRLHYQTLVEAWHPRVVIS